ncbi:MAG: M67 family metallopeptidase [Mariprofundus sp.]|nr:M67 family metallopeptidase [Mariprofundus sp.]
MIDEHDSTAQIHIPESCLHQLSHQAEAGYPLEICGLLIGSLNDSQWQVSEIRPVENLNKERAADRFQLDPAGYQAIDKELRGSGQEIIGVFHSHPDCPARPSPTDLQSAWEGFAYPIISVCDGKVAELRCWEVNHKGDRFRSVTINNETST